MSYDDLSNNPNPYARGTPPADLERESNYSDYPEGAAQNTTNPNSGGAGVFSSVEQGLAGSVASGLDAAYSDQLQQFSGGTDSQPTYEDYMIDKGLDDQNIPVRERR